MWSSSGWSFRAYANGLRSELLTKPPAAARGRAVAGAACQSSARGVRPEVHLRKGLDLVLGEVDVYLVAHAIGGIDRYRDLLAPPEMTLL